MKWMSPGLIELTEEENRDLCLAIATEEAWADVGGMDKLVLDTAAEHGCVASVIELEAELVEVSGGEDIHDWVWE